MDGKVEPGPPDPGAPPGEATFGWWPSPWPAAAVAAGKVSRGGLQADRGSFYWCESRPDLGGRQVVVRAQPGRARSDVSPQGVSVRSQVHEYGGGAVTVADGAVFYVDQADQRWYRTTPGAGPEPGATTDPVPLTPHPPTGGPSIRHADGRVTRSGRWLLSIEERVSAGATDHRLVAVAVDGSLTVAPVVEEGQFLTAPRPSPDGRWLAWVTWEHPFMPWDRSELWLARMGESAQGVHLHDPVRVAGGGDISVGQPVWGRDGSLVFIDDRSGWWIPYRLDHAHLGDGARSVPLVQRRSEFHAPDWVVGQATLAELSDGTLVSRMREAGRDQVVRLRPASGSPRGADTAGTGADTAAARPWSVEVVEQPCVSIAGLAVGEGDRVGVVGSTVSEAQVVFEMALDGSAPPRRLSAEPRVAVAWRASGSRPFTATTPAGRVPGVFFAPIGPDAPVGSGPPVGPDARESPEAPGPGGPKPPLVVFCHGGPTSAAEVGFDPVVQFFTSRGLAVAIVDYRGSSGYGRAYRRALDGLWGEADVDDCVAYASALEAAGWVDGTRMAIRGTSAGGLTALGALIRSRRFAGAAAWYGVTDLEALAGETHDFESRYVDSLVGPWPEAAEVYRSRSPINHPDEVSGQVLLLQGEDDPVVPPSQSERFAARLREHHVPCILTLFAGESHGFRRADTIEACLTAELDFYRSLFAGAGGRTVPTPTGPAGGSH